MRTSSFVAMAAVLGLVACAESYYYSPEGASVMRAGAPAQVVKIPPEAQQGTVEMASQGVRKIRTNDGRTVPALNVRMIVDNEGDDQPWTVDTREQLAEIPGVGRSRAIFVNSDTQTLPTITVPRRTRHTIDFYFPLPPQRAKEERVPSFDFLWQVNTSTRRIADRAHFRRLEEEPYTYYDTWGGPWGPYWWYDPFWPSALYVGDPFFFDRPFHHHYYRR